MTERVLAVGAARFVIRPQFREVETRFDDGFVMPGTREVTDVTKADCSDLGYEPTAAGVWRSLVEHELLHSVVAQLAWKRVSPVLRHEAGAERVPYYERLYEEALVLAMQRYWRTNQVAPVLATYRIDQWRSVAESLLTKREVA